MPPPITATRPMAAPRTVHKAATNKARPVTTPDCKGASPAPYKNAKAASASAVPQSSPSTFRPAASSATSASNKAPAYNALTTSSWNPCAASAATTRHRTAAPSTEPSRSTSNEVYRTKKELSIVRHGEIILYKLDLILSFHPVMTPHCALSRQSAHPAN